MNTEALHQAIRVLRAVEADSRPFNMHAWVSPIISFVLRDEPDCGTASCAAGWCGRDAWFKAHGFTVARVASHFGFVPVLDTGNGEWYDWFACAAMFGLSMDETHFLFLAKTYSGQGLDIMPRDVIARIETLLARHAPPAVKHEAPARELVPA